MSDGSRKIKELNWISKMRRVVFWIIFCGVNFNVVANTKDAVKNLKVEYGQFRYHLKYSPSSLMLKGEGIEISFKAEKCNQDFILETFNRIENQMKYPFLPVLPQNGLRITQADKVFFEESETKRGTFFKAIPSLFKQLVIEEQLLCKK